MVQRRRLTLFATGRVQAVSLVQGSGDIGLPVAGATASVNTRRSTLLDSGSRDADSEAGNGGDDLCLSVNDGLLCNEVGPDFRNLPWR